MPTDSIQSGPGSSPYLAKTTSANAATTPPPESFGHIDESDGEVIIIVGFVAIIAVALLAGFCSQARKSGDGEDAHYLHNRGKTTASVRSLFSLLMLSMIRDRLARARREELRRKQDSAAATNSSSNSRAEGVVTANNLSGLAMIDDSVDAESETEAQREREMSENDEESSAAEEYSVRNSVDDILI